MNDTPDPPAGKRSALRQPEMLVAMAAIVLSVCGLFIALYEASIARRAERSSVWPHVELAASVRGTRLAIFVRNTGVGPARIRAANLSHEGAVLDDWSALIRTLDVDAGTIKREYSLIGGRVLGVDSEPETIFAVDVRADNPDPDASRRVAEAFFDGSADVTLCYCSVYDECWIARLQDIMNRSISRPAGAETGEIDCASITQSAI